MFLLFIFCPHVRGLAVPDLNTSHGIRLLIEDYPYAVDGLEIWTAITTWVDEYCSFYYPTNDLIHSDSELQSWWSELRTVGHGDKKRESWWPKMQTRAELIQTCTTIIWVASALHAAVNFGQYPYAGYLPNRPTISRRFMPEPGMKRKHNKAQFFILFLTKKCFIYNQDISECFNREYVGKERKQSL